MASQCCRRELLLSSLSYDVVATIRPDSKWWLPEVAAGLVWCVRQLLNNRTWWQEASGKKHQLALFVSPIDQRSPEHASDRYAVGTPRAILYYLDGWTSAPKYWAQPPSASPNRPSTSWARTPHNLLLVGERFVGWHLRNPHANFEWGWMPMFHKIEDFPNAPTPNFFVALLELRVWNPQSASAPRIAHALGCPGVCLRASTIKAICHPL